jgi:hypothetical protein
MVDETLSGGGSTASICPWCSATYTGDRDTCPSCHAALAADPTADSALPGLTAIDTAAIVRSKIPVARPRNRLLSWISGEYPEASGPAAEAGALAPPDPAVRREMLRLELEAEVANLQAEADALLSEATAEGRVSAPARAAAAAVLEEIEAVTAGLDQVDALGTTDGEPVVPGDATTDPTAHDEGARPA